MLYDQKAWQPLYDYSTLQGHNALLNIKGTKGLIIAVSHMWLFKLIKIENKLEKFSSSVRLAPVLEPYIEHFYHHKYIISALLWEFVWDKNLRFFKLTGQ